MHEYQEDKAIALIKKRNELDIELMCCLRRQDKEGIPEEDWELLMKYEAQLRDKIREIERKLNLLQNQHRVLQHVKQRS